MMCGYLSSSYCRILLNGLLLYLVFGDVTTGHWRNPKNNEEGVMDLLLENARELSPEGNEPDIAPKPFDTPGGEKQKWDQFVDMKMALLKEKIAEVREDLRSVQKMTVDDISGQSIDEAKTNITILLQMRNSLVKEIKMLKHFSSYLESVKSEYDDEIPIEWISMLLTAIQQRKRVSSLLENSPVLLKFMRAGKTNPVVDPERGKNRKSKVKSAVLRAGHPIKLPVLEIKSKNYRL